jgi:DNA-binding CsgD family transcriptional regulator
MRGDPDGALALLAPTTQTVEAMGDHGFSAIVNRVLGDVHLVAGNHVEAWRALSTCADSEDAAQWHDPGALLLLPSYVDAALGVGGAQAAVERTALVRARAERLGRRDNVLAGCAYARLAVLAANGALDEAVAEVPGVVAAYDAPDRCALERGLAFLLAGRVYRRAKAKRQAESMLVRAASVFEELPCPPYLARARNELARVGLRPRASSELTPTELHVAMLAADGLRNHEIATQAFVSPRTVEAILSRTYRKLGIRSRAELARALDSTRGD